MSNGAAIVARVAVKPVSTLRKPLDSVDLVTGEVRRAHIERSDVAILPRAAVVGEAMLALALADALLADLGGDTVADLRAAVARRRRRSAGPRGRRGAEPDGRTQPELEALPADAARRRRWAARTPDGRGSPGVLRFRLLGHGHRLLGVAGDDGGGLRGARPAASLRARRCPGRRRSPPPSPRCATETSGGANVTVPHKAAVASLVDELSDLAREADAVNTIVRDGRRLVGHNTDLPAIVEAVGRLCPDGVRRAVVLGAGGAGRAAQLALADGGRRTASACCVARTAPSVRLADELAGADLLVNATPVGTGSDESLVPAALHRPDLAVLDLVYRPSPTRLVREARAAGARAEAGAGVLLGQAWRSLELWLGQPAPVAAMRAALDAELGGRSDA